MNYLSPHFTLDELTRSDTAVRLGIDNTPDADVLQAIQVLADGAERVRHVLGCPMHPSSGFRCEALEKVVARKDFISWCGRHGKDVGDEAWGEYFPRKAHPKGLALDFVAPGYGDPSKVVAAIADERDYIGFEQCIAEGTWVHISFPMSGRGKGEVMTAKFKDGVPSYTRGLV